MCCRTSLLIVILGLPPFPLGCIFFTHNDHALETQLLFVIFCVMIDFLNAVTNDIMFSSSCDAINYSMSIND